MTAVFPKRMSSISIQTKCWLLFVAFFAITKWQPTSSGIIYDTYERPAIDVDKILQERGFLTSSFDVLTKDGYILNVIRARNPLFKEWNKEPCPKPILFIHGTLSLGTMWLSQSANARPKDFTAIDAASASEEQLHLIFGAEPSARSMPIFLLNFGCEVWIQNARGTPQSPGKIDNNSQTKLATELLSAPSTINYRDLNVASFFRAFEGLINSTISPDDLVEFPNSTQVDLRADQFDEPQDGTLLDFFKPIFNLPYALTSYGKVLEYTLKSLDVSYWNFTLDQQAEFDTPATVDFVLEHSQSKQLVLVAHSTGAALALMRLSDEPSFADKISCPVFYSPALELGDSPPDHAYCALFDLFNFYTGPIPPVFLSQPIQGILQAVCNNKLTQSAVCPTIIALYAGFTGLQAPSVS